MDTHSLPLHVSPACSRHMHRGCPITGCGCNCHTRCAHCGKECGATYDVSQVIGSARLVCSECYIVEMSSRWRKVCECCGAMDAYCDPRVSAYFFCVPCFHRHDLSHTTAKPAS